MASAPPNFKLPVDSEHKSTKLKLYSAAAPHMRAFQLTWLSFFACFVSTFAAPPLLPIIRDNLNLTRSDIGRAGIASVSGAVFARVAMGTACDLFGPRLASASLMLLTAPFVYLTSTIMSPTGFLLCRFFTGFSLCSFVSTQFWMSSMFSAPVVGAANGFAAGWGNLGGGLTQLLMPVVFKIIHDIGATQFMAWRIAFFIPAIFQTLTAYAVLMLGQDLPDGNFHGLQKSGEKPKDQLSKVLKLGFTNYRGWILALTYGYCFGVELTVDNIIAEYFYDRFDLQLHTAGIIAASFGLLNVFSRPGGGILSDELAKRFGMRGRLWGLWTVQTLGGVFCIILGKVGSLGGSFIACLIFSLLVQAACGLTFGVVPFVSRRALGLIFGMTGGGGNIGAVLTHLLFLRGPTHHTEDGIYYMGVMIIICTLPLCLIYFPQWGGMFCSKSSSPDATEESYYLSEWSATEKEKWYHLASEKFAQNSKSERSNKPKSVPTAKEISLSERSLLPQCSSKF